MKAKDRENAMAVEMGKLESEVHLIIKDLEGGFDYGRLHVFCNMYSSLWCAVTC